MLVPKWPFLFFTGKYKILKLYPNGHSFFYSEMQNFENYPNGYSFFYNEIQNFENFTQMVICISYKEIRNLTICHQFSFVS